MLPVHILFLQLIIDPSCSIVFEAEPEGPDTMNRPPRPRDASLLDRATLLSVASKGRRACRIASGLRRRLKRGQKRRTTICGGFRDTVATRCELAANPKREGTRFHCHGVGEPIAHHREPLALMTTRSEPVPRESGAARVGAGRLCSHQ